MSTSITLTVKSDGTSGGCIQQPAGNAKADEDVVFNLVDNSQKKAELYVVLPKSFIPRPGGATPAQGFEGRAWFVPAGGLTVRPRTAGTFHCDATVYFPPQSGEPPYDYIHIIIVDPPHRH